MELIFKVDGMSCGHCVMAVKKELSKANISDYRVEIGKVVVNTEKDQKTSEQVIKAIEDAGYRVVEQNQ